MTHRPNANPARNDRMGSIPYNSANAYTVNWSWVVLGVGAEGGRPLPPWVSGGITPGKLLKF